MSIVLNNDLNKYLLKFLRVLCERFQKNFDVSPGTLHKLTNDPEFIEDASFITKQYTCKMRQQISEFKQSFEAIAANQQPSFVTCGQIKKINNNVFIEYCNIHKYLHYDSPEIKYDHQFVKKSLEQELNEYYYLSILNIFQNSMNSIYLVIERLFFELIDNRYQIIMMSVNRMNLAVEAIEENSSYFKTKKLYISSKDKAIKKDKEDKEDKLSYYFRIFIPRNIV